MDQVRGFSFDWALWFQWIVATTMGWFLGQVLLPGLALFVTGPLIAAFQWPILQHRIQTAWQWILASAIGWLLGGILVLVAIPVEFEFLVGPVFGLAMGIAQWVVLRRQVHWAGWWIIISALAWTSGLSLLPGMLFSGVLIGAMTGIALDLLLRTPRHLQAKEPS